MKLTFNVDFEKQTITRTDDCEPVANSENYLEAEYTCTGYAEGMVLTPVFMRGTKLPVGSRDIYIPSFTQEGDIVTCIVPSEVICGKGFIASIFAYDVNKDERITVDRLIIWLKESGYCGVQIPSKDIYAQILEMLASLNVDEIEAMVKQGEQIIGDGLEALNAAVDNGITNINNTVDNGMTNINNTVSAGVTTINDNVNAGVNTVANTAAANVDTINNVTNTNIGNINDVTNTNLDNINSIGNTVVTNVNTAETKATSTINNEGNTVVTNINTAETKALNTISSLEETAQNNINTNANQHIQNIDAEAEAKIAEIAEMELVGKWTHVLSASGTEGRESYCPTIEIPVGFKELRIYSTFSTPMATSSMYVYLNDDYSEGDDPVLEDTYGTSNPGLIRWRVIKLCDDFYEIVLIGGASGEVKTLVQRENLEKVYLQNRDYSQWAASSWMEGFVLCSATEDDTTDEDTD